MGTYIVMTCVVIFLALTLFWGASLQTGDEHFFDKGNTNAMRGFWSLIVLLVHIPSLYQNKIQDILGSFAYIGVTFFFMTSAFGLKSGMAKSMNGIKAFWRRRLPKLLVSNFLINIVAVGFSLVKKEGIDWKILLSINGWVQWILICYMVFWAVYRFIPGGYRDTVICCLIIIFSSAVYILKDRINGTTWCPEIYGFVWGLILFNHKERFVRKVREKWLVNCFIFCILAGVTGMMYLKFKPIIFFGDYILKIILGITIIIFMLAVNTKLKIGNKISLFLGGMSYEIYLLHGIVFGLLAYVMPEVWSGMFITISLVATVVLAAIVNPFAKKISTKIEMAINHGKG